MLDWKWKFPCLTDQDNEEIYLFRAKRDYQPRDYVQRNPRKRENFISFGIKTFRPVILEERML